MKYTVMVCDDSALARKMAKRSLPDGFSQEIIEAQHGKEALEILAGGTRVDLLILDLTMPEIDGLCVLEAIKANNYEVFVIVVSGDIQPQMRERVMQLGALDFIAKPVKAPAIAQVLERFGFILAEEMA